jgi:hypothetical protein
MSVDDWESVLVQDPVTKIVHNAKKAPPFASLRWVTSCGKKIVSERAEVGWLVEKIVNLRWKEVEGKRVTCRQCRKNGQVKTTNDGT